jgi:mannose-6-phosphate isomerase-like protein (cupin superfamily)
VIALRHNPIGLAPRTAFLYPFPMPNSPYHFPAADHPLKTASDRLKVREALSPFGIALRYQERAPDPAGTPPRDHWCETGHSIFVLSGRIRYRFDDHVVEAGPGDMLHIPAGPAHRHQPSVVGDEVVRYVLTEFA